MGRIFRWLTAAIAFAVIGSFLTLPPAPALSNGASVTWGNTYDLTEQDPALTVGSDVQIQTGKSYDGKYVEFSVTSSNIFDQLGFLTVDARSTVNGVVSIEGTSVYLGNGTTADPIGSVDSTRNGQNGQPLRINFVSSFSNAGFEEATLTGWTPVEQRVRLGITQINGVTVPARPRWFTRCTNDLDDDVREDNEIGTPTWDVSLSGDYKTEGTQSLKLFMSATATTGRGWYLHGPAVYSAPFEASQGDEISFDWRAVGSGDHSSVFGYIRNTGTNATTIVLDDWTSEPYDDTPEARSTDWANVAVEIPTSGSYEFVFISGAHNADCGVAGNSSLYIDNVQVFGSKVTDAVAEKVANLVTYRNTSDAPPASRTLSVTAVASDTTSLSASATVNIAPVNDAPVVSGTATVNEDEEDTLAAVTGSLTASDPDGDDPTLAYGLIGGVSSGENLLRLVGTYGTLEVNTVSGAFTYTPNMSAIKGLDTGDIETDTFPVTASDGTLEGQGDFVATINGFTDTEPSVPTIVALVPGDGFLGVLFDAPQSSGTSSLVNYEYSTNGEAFRAFDPVAPSGPLEISLMSGDGTTPLENGEPYTVAIRAVNGTTSSASSNSLSGTPSDVPEVSEPNIQTLDVDTAFEPVAEDFRVSGFAATDTLLVTLGMSGQASGTEFRLPNFATSGAAAGTGYTYTNGAVTELAVTGSQSEVNTALRGLELKTGADSSDFSLNVSASVAQAGIVQSGVTQSFYEFVADSGVTWSEARDAAAEKTYLGLTGYLVTITSAEENAFVAGRIPDASNVWVGASDAAVEGDWRWVTGPEGQNGGTRFWFDPDGPTKATQDPNSTSYSPPTRSQACTATGSGIEGSIDPLLITYACWSTGEPNNGDTSRGGEHAVVTNWNSNAGLWNDLAGANSGSVAGYVVEYSEWGGQQASAASFVRSQVSVSMGGPVLTATAGSSQVSLSWSVPPRTNQTVSEYSVSVVPSVSSITDCTGSDTTCVVTDLTNGVEYTFRVTATWSDAVTTLSTFVTARPVAPPPPATTPRRTTPVADPVPQQTQNPVVPPGRATPTAPAVSPPTQSGPVLVGGTPPTPPNQPVARSGNTEVPVNTQVVSPDRLDIRAGTVSLGVSVPETVGGVRQTGGTNTELDVRSGGQTTLQGAGVLPGSAVQVFLPLQGSNAKELAQIQADENGVFNGDALFATQRTEAPLPVGRQVLQIVSLDENGEQMVMELTVNIAQPAPAPEFDRSQDQLPALQPGQSFATEAGLPVDVQVSADTEQNRAVVEGDGWVFAVNVSGQSGAVDETEDGGASLTFVRNQTAIVEGGGFLPGSRADVWLFSEPTLMGSVTIDENGEFNGELSVDGRVITVGEHTLQLQGIGADGYVRAANLGVIVQDDDTAAVTAAETTDGFTGWLWVIALIALVVLVAITVWFTRRSRENLS